MSGLGYINTSNGVYRFGFNGQERDDEVAGAGNTMTAEFWEYDSRLGRRWNLDPESMTDISEYAVFANNPNYFTDPFGNTLDIGKNMQSKKDVLSLVSKGNHKFLKFDEKTNRVTMDFGNMKEPEIKKLLSEDEGLNLINEMVAAPQKFLYEADNLALLKDENGSKTGVMMHLDGNGVINASDKGLDSEGKYTYLPRDGYDGQMVVQLGATWQETYTSSDGTVQYKVDKLRSTVIFHELAENYERALGTNYHGYGKALGAHNRAELREQKWVNKSLHPGVAEIKNRSLPSEAEIIEMKKRIKKCATGG